jgi:hypothetical protein
MYVFVAQNETLMYFSKASDESGKDKYDIKHNTRVLDCDGPPAFSFKVETPGDVERGPIMAGKRRLKQFPVHVSALQDQVLFLLSPQRRMHTRWKRGSLRLLR